MVERINHIMRAVPVQRHVGYSGIVCTSRPHFASANSGIRWCVMLRSIRKSKLLNAHDMARYPLVYNGSVQPQSRIQVRQPDTNNRCI